MSWTVEDKRLLGAAVGKNQCLGFHASFNGILLIPSCRQEKAHKTQNDGEADPEALHASSNFLGRSPCSMAVVIKLAIHHLPDCRTDLTYSIDPRAGGLANGTYSRPSASA